MREGWRRCESLQRRLPHRRVMSLPSSPSTFCSTSSRSFVNETNRIRLHLCLFHLPQTPAFRSLSTLNFARFLPPSEPPLHNFNRPLSDSVLRQQHLSVAPHRVPCGSEGAASVLSIGRRADAAVDIFSFPRCIPQALVLALRFSAPLRKGV